MCNQSVTARDFMQMLARIRNPTSTIINLLIDSKIPKSKIANYLIKKKISSGDLPLFLFKRSKVYPAALITASMIGYPASAYHFSKS